MANKRSRKAAARKRAAALAAKVVPMNIDNADDGDEHGNGGIVPICGVESQGVESVQKAIDISLLNGPSVPRHRLQRLSPEELRLCSILAQKQALAFMEIAPPLPISPRFKPDDSSAPDIVTPAMAAARFACASHTAIIGHAKYAKSLNEAYETAENEFVLTEQQDEDNLYIFHAYDDDDELEDDIDGDIEEDEDDQVEILPIHDFDQGNGSANANGNMSEKHERGISGSKYRSGTPLQGGVPEDILSHPAIMTDALNSAETRRLQRRPDNDHSNNANNNDSDEDDDEDVSGSSSSLWTSFGRLFNFGRSPSYQSDLTISTKPVLGDTGPKSPDRFPPPILNTNSNGKDDKLFVASSPVTPAAPDEDEEHCSSCRKENNDRETRQRNGNSNGNGNRRVLRAARTLKQHQPGTTSTSIPSSSSSCTTPPEVMVQLAPLLEAAATYGASAVDHGNVNGKALKGSKEERKRAKKGSKVKRRPRVRLVDEENE